MFGTMNVRDAMTEHVLTITPGRSLREAARFMTEHNVGAVVIIDPEAGEVVYGFKTLATLARTYPVNDGSETP